MFEPRQSPSLKIDLQISALSPHFPSPFLLLNYIYRLLSYFRLVQVV